MSDETRWDAIRRRLNEGNCWPSGPVFEVLTELEREAVIANQLIAELEAENQKLHQPRWERSGETALETYSAAIERARQAGQWAMLNGRVIVALADELESLRDDAALGALVRQMAKGASLTHLYGNHQWLYVGPGVDTEWLDTPEAALMDGLNKISRICENDGISETSSYD